jgi:hypothetical protein
MIPYDSLMLENKIYSNFFIGYTGNVLRTRGKKIPNALPINLIAFI